MAFTPIREQIILVVNDLFMIQSDLTTALDLENLNTSLDCTQDGKNFFTIDREYKERASCTGEDKAARKVKSQMGRLNVTIKCTPEQAYGVAALARGVSGDPVAVGDGTHNHTTARMPAYNYDLPGTTAALVFAETPAAPVKILRGVKVDSYEIIGSDGEYVTMSVSFIFYPVTTDVDIADFTVPACTDYVPADSSESTVTIDAVDQSVDLLDFRIRYANRIRTGRFSRTNNGRNPTRIWRDPIREESMDLTFSKATDDGYYAELEAGTDIDHATVVRAGTATSHITHSYPHSHHSFANGGGAFSGDGNPFVTAAHVEPLAVGGVTSIVTSRNTKATKFLPAAA
jgi:hypothetical protein